MNDMEIESIEAAVLNLIQNEPVGSVSLPSKLDRFRELLLELETMIQQQQEFARSLSSGDLKAKLPPRTNYLSNELKQLHAQMLHLTWQARCVSKGNYKQRLDFMGDLSSAFNSMLDCLNEREQNYRNHWNTVQGMFELMPEVVFVEHDGSIEYKNNKAKQLYPENDGIIAELLRLSTQDYGKTTLEDQKTNQKFKVAYCSMLWNEKQDSRLFICSPLDE